MVDAYKLLNNVEKNAQNKTLDRRRLAKNTRQDMEDSKHHTRYFHVVLSRMDDRNCNLVFVIFSVR